MTEISTAYILARGLFDAFRGKSDVLTQDEIENSRVCVRPGHMTDVEGIVAFGRKEDARASQRLSLGRQGLFYFSTTFGYPHGGYRRELITPRSEKGFETMQDSFFVEALERAIRGRNT